MAETIRAYVLRRLAEGAEPIVVWREQLHRQFPTKIASWTYVCALKREFDRSKDPCR